MEKHLHKMKYYPVSIDLMNKEAKKNRNNNNNETTAYKTLSTKSNTREGTDEEKQKKISNLWVCRNSLMAPYSISCAVYSISVQIASKVLLNVIDSGNDMAFSSFNALDHFYICVVLHFTRRVWVQKSASTKPKQIRHTELVCVSFDLWSMVFRWLFLGFCVAQRMKIFENPATTPTNSTRSDRIKRIFDRVIFYHENVNLPSNPYKLAHFSGVFQLPLPPPRS